MPNRHWVDADPTAVCLLARMLSKALNFKTQLQTLSTYVSLSTMLMIPPRVFGCVAFVQLPKNQCTKLDPRVI